MGLFQRTRQKLGIVGELFEFLWERKLWWLIPMVAVLILFGILLVLADIQTPAGRRRPRIHDLRHTFAVNTLIDWYRSGVDVQARMPILSTFLGHSGPEATYWYLQATPELLALAAQRLEHDRRTS